MLWQRAINKLSVNMGKDAEKFAKVGITAKKPIEAFQQLADVLGLIEDPQQRAAVAAEALGKSWASTAPLLAEGGQRIGEMIERGTRLSGITQEMAENADKLNDQFEELKMLAGGFSNKLASDMLPGMISMIGTIKTAYEESGKLTAAWVALGGFGAFLFTDEFASDAKKAAMVIKETENQILSLEAKKEKLRTSGGGYLQLWLFGTTNDIDAEISSLKRGLEDFKKTFEKKGPATDSASNGKSQANAAAKAKVFLGGSGTVKEASEYDKLIRSIKEKIAVQESELEATENLTEGEKLAAKFKSDLRTGVLKLTQAQKAAVTTALDNLITGEKLNAQKKLEAEATKAAAEAHVKYIADLVEETKRIQDQIDDQRNANDALKLNAQALVDLEAAKLRDKAAHA
jgi:hypothetical protein